MKKYLFLLTIFSYYISTSQSVDYATEIQPIFNNSCMPCHSGSNPSGELNLTSYENVMAGNVLIAGDYQNSILWQKVSSGDMPNDVANNIMNIPDLTTAEVNLIMNWIIDLDEPPTNIDEILGDQKKIIKIFNPFGKEVAKHSKEKILIYLYDDNSIKKECC